jgi:hypothetical protein
MSRFVPLAALAAFVAWAAPGAAAPPAEPPQPPPIRLTLRPAAAPSPALKYRLLPEVRDRSPGNAVILYYRAFSPEALTHRRHPELLTKVQKSNEGPLAAASRGDLEWLRTVWFLKEVDRAARRAYCDWELIDRLREDGIGLVLPDMQELRNFAALLRGRARLELLDGRFDQAARTLQTGAGLGTDLAQAPLLISNLVGIAVCNQMLDTVEDWVQRPDSPNLYWALTDLPRPLVDLRKGLEGERLTVDSLLPGYREMLADPKAALPPPDQARGAQAGFSKARLLLEGLDSGGDRLAFLRLALRTYPQAKRFLRSQGWAEEQVEGMPALQAVLLYQVHRYDVAYDELLKYASLPYPEGAAGLRRITRRPPEGREDGGSLDLADLLVPAVGRAVPAAARLDRRVAALRCVEALRLHAAAHGGEPPARLADVHEVPVPADPVTGQPFDYRQEGDRAVLSAPPPPGEAPDARNSLRYELTFKP